MRRASVLTLALGLAASPRVVAQQPEANPHGPIKVECSACHSPEAWVPARISSRFDHAQSGMPLTGAHTRAKCRACHPTLDFKGVGTECVACHRDVHQGELGGDCVRCHTTRNFLDRVSMVRMHQTTRFPLAGAHLVADCESCHQPSAQGAFLFAARATNCIDCHLSNYTSAKDPDHVGGSFTQDCTQCHTVVSWSGAKFDHNASRFPLTGTHRTIACQQCHADGIYAGKNINCISCHQQDWTGTTDPGHQAAGFPTDCSVCHTTSSWTGALFDHNTTKFPLTGAHRSVACQQCHGDGVYVGKSTACVSCHQQDYNATTDPAHQAAGFPTDCATCHTTNSWSGATFNHTWFNANHQGAGGVCTECHLTTNYAQSTCSNHHHPATCTYLNQRACGD